MSGRFQLREEYAVVILNEAKLKFRGQYLGALTRRIARQISLKTNVSEVRDALDGKRCNYVLLEALCREFNIDWTKAVRNVSQRSSPVIASRISRFQAATDIDKSISDICEKIRFPFEKETHSFMLKPFGEWLKHNFIDLELCEVDALPSQYPVFDREELFKGDKGIQKDDFNRLGISLLHGEKIHARDLLQAEKNFFVYGDPGSGKSTYLKWIALKCKDRELLTNYLPIFLEVRQFSVDSNRAGLLTYLLRIFEGWGVDPDDVQRIISSGRALFILDGVDETHKPDRDRIESLITNLLINHNTCRFILSSRLGFDITFSALKKVVIVPFHSSKQIPLFVEKWFGQTEKGLVKAKMMLEKLRDPKYGGISEISRRPVLLKLLCYLFEKYDDFPDRRAAVFQAGIEELVRQSKFYIESELGEHPEITTSDITGILCRIASYFFINSEGDILFNKREVERIIKEYYLEFYPENSTAVNPDFIIRVIEQYNGLLVRWSNTFCSFSHLTYQEYFVAQHLVNEDDQDLVYDYLINPRWQFVIGLVAELLPQDKTHDFFTGFKYHIDRIVNDDERITDFLQALTSTSWLAIHASGEMSMPFSQVLARSWYLVYALGEYTTQVGGFLPSKRKRSLPDMIYAVSMISNEVLEVHATLYDLYHCIHKDEYSQLVMMVNRAIKLFESKEPQKAAILTTWLTQIHNQLETFGGDSYQWWEDRVIRSKWKRRIIEVMQGSGVPCPSEIRDEQIALLNNYYSATHLFSNCVNRSELSKNSDSYERFVNNMLLIEHMPPKDEVQGFDDGYNF